MIDDITDIRLVPAWTSPTILPALARSIRDFDLLQGAIAYWTVDSNLFGKALAQRFGVPSGFLCVDIHMPTDIDELSTLVREGAHVKLYCEDITTYRADGKKE